MKKNYLILVFLACSSLLWAQEKTVSGTVTDAAGVPLIGANVLIQGTTSGTQTDFDGNYSISVSSGQVLVFSYIGYKGQNVTVGSGNTINVTLEEDASKLDEIVVIGYGTQKVVNLTGSVEVIKGEEIARQPVFQTSQALAGLAPGLVATQSSGQPGADGATIRIRGIGTFGNSGNNPLILVDGIPDSLNGVDPNDIESISILKDASASAIYGSRAANGVIIITTKRGKIGKVSVNYDTYVGFQDPVQNLKFLDGLGYIEQLNIANPGTYTDDFIADYIAGRGTDAFPDTDWVDEVFSENGFQQYHRLGVNGGTEKIKVSASISYMDQEGNIPNFDFRRFNGRFNTDVKISEKFDINFDLNFRRSERRDPSAGLGEITRQAYRIPPLFTAINSDGSWGPGWNGQNPVAGAVDGGRDFEQFNYFRGTLKVNYRPIEDLVISMTYSPQHNDDYRKTFRAQYDWVDLSQSGTYPNSNSLSESNNRGYTDNFNVVTTYDKTFGDHNVGGTLGYEFLKNDTNRFSASRRNFILQGFQQLDSGDADTQLNSGSANLFGLESAFGRINYTYKDKYLFEANLRRDASSRFAPQFRADWFPSFSAGWTVSNEAFLENISAISFLKLRASWGQLGNQNVGTNFAYVSLFGVGTSNPIIGGGPITGGAQSVLANRALTWETGESTNFALDAKFFDNRLALTAEYYIRETNDILLSSNSGIPPSIGLSAPRQNIGSVENKGWDLAVDWQDNIGSDFNYSVNFNISDYKNEVTDLGEGIDELPPGGTITRVGESLGSIFGLKKVGLFQDQAEIDSAPTHGFGPVSPGDVRYEDINGDGTVNNDDRTIIGNSLSRLNYGLDLSASYKGFDFSVSFLGVGKRDIVLSGDAAYPFFNAGKIQEWQTDVWTPQNTDAQYPRYTPGSSHSNWRTSEQWLFDASYLRVRNITLGYSFPENVLETLKINSLRLYLSGQNLFTFDNLPDGIDPTIPNFSSGAFFPVNKVYTFGLRVSL